MGKKKGKKTRVSDTVEWEDMRRDESITEEVILLELRCAMSSAIGHKQADAANDLASAHAYIATAMNNHREAGF